MANETPKIVLLVDDEDLFRSSVAEALSLPSGAPGVANAMYVLTAADGAEALAILRRQEVDLLITDINMPVMDGIQLLGEYMNLQPGRPTIVITAHGSPEIEEQLRALGGVSYLEKPIDLGTLHQRVEEALRPRTHGHIEGITLFGFLQLLEIERKSCTLTLRLGERRAQLSIRAGELVHAETDGVVGDAAVLALGDWESPEIDIENVCRTRKRTVETRLTELLLEAARLADERREYGAAGGAAADEAAALDRLEPGADPTAAPAETNDNAATTPHNRGEGIMASLKETLTKLTEIDGFMGACIVDSTSGMMLGSEGGGPSFNLEVAAAGNTEVVRAKRKTMGALGLKDAIEDILITLGRQYHLIRPLAIKDGLFAYLVLDKTRSNLALARHSLADAEKALVV